VVLGRYGANTRHKLLHLELQKALGKYFWTCRTAVDGLLLGKFCVQLLRSSGAVSLAMLQLCSSIRETSDRQIQDSALDTSNKLSRSELQQLG